MACFISIVFIVAVFGSDVYCASLSDAKTLATDLLTGYDPEIRPISDQLSKLNVTVTVYVKSIQEFNEVKETFLFTAVFILGWFDTSIVWNPASYGGLTSVMLSIDKVWVPQLVITTSSSHIVSFGQDWQKVLYLPNGQAYWSTGGLVRGTCSINVRSYPFDSQECASHFCPGPYYAKDVSFVADYKEVNMSIYAGNVIWDLHKASVSSYVVNSRSQLDVTFHLRRKSAFVVINVLIPLASLSFLNILVFFLVPCSGERVSYSITVLLAIAVFMTIISDTLTKSSEPVPLISYKLMIDMIISALITVVTVLNLGLYHRPETREIPRWLRSMYIKLHKCLILCTNKIQPKQDIYRGSNTSLKEKNGSPKDKQDIISVVECDGVVNVTEKEDSAEENNGKLEEIIVTWKEISYMVDFLSIVIFIGVSALSFLVFIMYLYF